MKLFQLGLLVTLMAFPAHTYLGDLVKKISSGWSLVKETISSAPIPYCLVRKCQKPYRDCVNNEECMKYVKCANEYCKKFNEQCVQKCPFNQEGARLTECSYANNCTTPNTNHCESEEFEMDKYTENDANLMEMMRGTWWLTKTEKCKEDESDYYSCFRIHFEGNNTNFKMRNSFCFGNPLRGECATPFIEFTFKVTQRGGNRPILDLEVTSKDYVLHPFEAYLRIHLVLENVVALISLCGHSLHDKYDSGIIVISKSGNLDSLSAEGKEILDTAIWDFSQNTEVTGLKNMCDVDTKSCMNLCDVDSASCTK